jgi:hypothetical protein
MENAAENGDFEIRKWAKPIWSAGSHDEMK